MSADDTTDISDTTETSGFDRLAEAVVISGPHKGEFIMVDGTQIMPPAAVEALMEQLIAAADGLKEIVEAQSQEISHLQTETSELSRALSDTRDRLIRSEAWYEAEKTNRANLPLPKKGN